MRQIPNPLQGPFGAEQFVAEHLAFMVEGKVRSSSSHRGGQSAANRALRALDFTDFAKHNRTVYPARSRPGSDLVPYVTSGLISLSDLVDTLNNSVGPQVDLKKFSELVLTFEYARHRRAADLMLNSECSSQSLRRWVEWSELSLDMGCVDLIVEEFYDDGVCHPEARRWLSNLWTNALDGSWESGFAETSTRLLDSDDSFNWLWWKELDTSVGVIEEFTRWQVEEFAPGVCATCELATRCPIEKPIPERARPESAPDTQPAPLQAGRAPDRQPIDRVDAVWLSFTALGDDSLALVHHPNVPVKFVLPNEELMKQKMSPLRLIFWVETIAELASTRTVEIWLGDPVEVFADTTVATTHNPLNDPLTDSLYTRAWLPDSPSSARRPTIADAIAPNVVTYPYRWLIEPQATQHQTYNQWRESHITQIFELGPAFAEQERKR